MTTREDDAVAPDLYSGLVLTESTLAGAGFDTSSLAEFMESRRKQLRLAQREGWNPKKATLILKAFGSLVVFADPHRSLPPAEGQPRQLNSACSDVLRLIFSDIDDYLGAAAERARVVAQRKERERLRLFEARRMNAIPRVSAAARKRIELQNQSRLRDQRARCHAMRVIRVRRQEREQMALEDKRASAPALAVVAEGDEEKNEDEPRRATRMRTRRTPRTPMAATGTQGPAAVSRRARARAQALIEIP